MHPHLTDEALNEYLDGALPSAQAAEAVAHLAGCAGCAARLDALRALFADLAALPEVAWARDLAPGVLAALPKALPMRNSSPARPRAVRWIAVAEALAALALLALAWPQIATLLAVVTAGAGEWLAGWLALGQAVWLAEARGWLAALLPAPPAAWLPIGELAPLTLGLAVAGAAALWAGGNVLMLRRSLGPRGRRQT